MSASRRPSEHPAPAAAPPEGTLAERIAAKLGEAQAALAGDDPAATRRHLAELQALVALLASESASLASLSDFLQAGTERDKAALARELHDSLGGILTPAKMDLAWLEERLGADAQYGPRMRRLSALIDQGIDLKRRIIENLRPSLLDHLGLASALQWHIDEACRGAGIDCRLHISDKLERLPPDLEIALYRVVQEALANVTQHAQARSVDISVERGAAGLRLAIVDDGVGFNAAAPAAAHGLAGIAHRVRSIGGRFEVRSAPGKGTALEAYVPLA